MLYGREDIKFDIRIAGEDTIEIGFQDANVFNITEVNNSQPLLKIEDHEAKSWSVFQATLELERLSKTTLGFDKRSHTVYIDADGTYYSPGPLFFVGTIIYPDYYFYWDAIAHEFSHAIADETDSTVAQGGYHMGNNQYDIRCDGDQGNSATCKNKEASLMLAFNEAYATWLGVSPLETPPIKDGCHTLAMASM